VEAGWALDIKLKETIFKMYEQLESVVRTQTKRLKWGMLLLRNRLDHGGSLPTMDGDLRTSSLHNLSIRSKISCSMYDAPLRRVPLVDNILGNPCEILKQVVITLILTLPARHSI
jgi:hypothetical protein